MTRRRSWMLAPVFALAIAGLEAQEKAAAPIQKEYEALVKEYEQAQAEYVSAVRKLAATDEYKQAVKDRDREAMTKLREGLKAVDTAEFARRFAAIADKAEGTDVGIEARIWVATSGPADQSKQAVQHLLEKHADSEAIVPLLEKYFVLLRTFGTYGAGDALDDLIAQSESDLVRAHAMYAKAAIVQRDRNANDEDKKAAEELLTKAANLAEGTLLADRIRAPQFEQERLQIGMEAPDIEGEDLDGVPFKLSDYRGKVVVLDFWGDW